MPSLSSHSTSQYVKLLLLGDSKAGKTTSLASLALAGYSLRILDFDNILDPLASAIRTSNPSALSNVEYRSLRDTYKATASGTAIDGRPRAWLESLRTLNHWKYDDVDLGVPAEWGPDTILVIDSLSRWCDSAYDLHSHLGGDKADGRAVYGNAQDDVERQLANLTSPNFLTNVIIICHGTILEMDGKRKIFPQGVGQKLSPKIPQYFPNYIRLTRKVDGTRIFELEGSSLIDLATTRASLLPGTLPATTGLATLFEVLRDAPSETEPSAPPALAPARPKSITLIRK